MSVSIKLKRGTEATVLAANLSAYEIAFTSDTKSIIVFDGSTKYKYLPSTVVGAASGIASLNADSLVVQNPANATATKTASKIPIADGSGYLNTWIQTGTTTGTICAGDDGRLPTSTQKTTLGYMLADATHVTIGSGATGYVGSTVIGVGAGGASVSGANNVFVGYNSGSHTQSGSSNVYMGYCAGQGLTGAGGTENVVIGNVAAINIRTAAHCVVIGSNAGVGQGGCTYGTYDGTYNVLVGDSAGINCDGNYNTMVGALAGASYNSGVLSSANSCFGYKSGYSLTSGANNVFVGYEAGKVNTSGANNCFVGHQSGLANTTGGSNCFFGAASGVDNLSGSNNTVIGYAALARNNNYHNNTAVGYYAGLEFAASNNTFIGSFAGLGASGASTGANNVFVGFEAGKVVTTGHDCVFSGYQAGVAATTAANSIAIGSGAVSGGDNYCQIGNASVATYKITAAAWTYNSDERDKADIRDTELGLDFIKALRPVSFKFDLRDDYRPPMPTQPTEPKAPTELQLPVEPTVLAEDATEEQIAQHDVDVVSYNDRLTQYNIDKPQYDIDAAQYEIDAEQHELDKAQYAIDWEDWVEACKVGNITHDGTHKRSRDHQGFVAQEIFSVLTDMGIDWAGYQDESIAHGNDRLGIVYEELFGPIVKSLQQIDDKCIALEQENSELRETLASVLERLSALENA